MRLNQHSVMGSSFSSTVAEILPGTTSLALISLFSLVKYGQSVSEVEVAAAAIGVITLYVRFKLNYQVVPAPSARALCSVLCDLVLAILLVATSALTLAPLTIVSLVLGQWVAYRTDETIN